MAWREEAKELGIAVYDKELKRPRKKVDVLADIEAKKEKPEDITGPTKIVVSVQEANKICSDALFKHVSEQGLENITCEKWFINCKRKGIVFKGIKNVRREEEETEEISSGVSGSDTDSERGDGDGGLEEACEDEQVGCASG